MKKCIHCPASGTCVVEWSRHNRYCDHAASGDPVWLDRISKLSASAPAYPPLATQAANALGSAAKFVASGGATVSQEEFDRRRVICQACPTRRYVADEDRCEACGCYLAVKPWGKAESCPDGHW